MSEQGCVRHCLRHCNGNIVILTKFSPVAAAIVVNMTVFGAVGDENFVTIVKITSGATSDKFRQTDGFSFQWIIVKSGAFRAQSEGCVLYYRTDSKFVPSQWETVLFCNDVSHWLGTSLKSALYYYSAKINCGDCCCICTKSLLCTYRLIYLSQ